MKNIFRFGFLALFMATVSCEDATDIIQEGELSEEAAYRTVDDLQSGLNGVYAQYGPDFGGNGLGDVILFNDLFTDNFKRGFQSNGQGNEEYNWIFNATSDFPNRIWSNRYATINFANRVLRNIDRVIEGASQVDIDRANHIRAQLITLRALCHFDLLQYFATDYQNDAAPGVIIMDFVPELGATFQRNTVGEVFEFIKSDLATAEGMLSQVASDNFYITQDALMAIRARVLLFEGDAANYPVIEQITETLLSRHELITDPEEYRTFWADGNLDVVSEDIWTLFRGQSDNGVGALYAPNGSDIDGSPFFEMSYSLYESYDEDDYRVIPGIFIDETSDVSGAEKTLIINKYPGGANGISTNHIKLFRASEMQLIKAEVEARQNKLDEAEASMFAIKDARSTSTPDEVSYGSLPDALVDILAERRRELCFEGHRFLDLKRIGKELSIGINRDSRDCASFNASNCELAPTSYLFTLPIPRNELNANNTIEQNPGY